MKPLALSVLVVLSLAACENPDFNVGASISNSGIRPSIGVSDGPVSVVVRP